MLSVILFELCKFYQVNIFIVAWFINLWIYNLQKIQMRIKINNQYCDGVRYNFFLEFYSY
jgi:hypothetical protein